MYPAPPYIIDTTLHVYQVIEYLLESMTYPAPHVHRRTQLLVFQDMGSSHIISPELELSTIYRSVLPALDIFTAIKDIVTQHGCLTGT